MGRKKKPEADKAVNIGLRFPPDLVKRIDAEIERRTQETGEKITRTMTVMALIRQGLEARAKARGDK